MKYNKDTGRLEIALYFLMEWGFLPMSRRVVLSGHMISGLNIRQNPIRIYR